MLVHSGYPIHLDHKLVQRKLRLFQVLPEMSDWLSEVRYAVLGTPSQLYHFPLNASTSCFFSSPGKPICDLNNKGLSKVRWAVLENLLPSFHN